jgi:Spirocyclase AveC-like
LSVFGQHWFTYNAYLVNFGSVMTVIPGVTSLNARGVGQPFPILFMPALYVAGVVPLSILGCAIMRRLRERYGLSSGQLVLACFLLMLLVDVIGEGIVLIPLGFWSYEGAHLALFPSHVWRYPFQEGIHAAGFFTAVTCVRFFVDDAGATIAERGLSSLRIGPGKRLLVRFLAVLALVQGGFLVVYHLPEALWGLNSTSWPHAAQHESYFTNGICGPHVNRACPGPGIPNGRPGSTYVNFEGALVRP